MKSLMRLLECVLTDVSIWCGTSTTRDFNTVSRRVKHEGMSFLTICLPSYCSDFERSLADGVVDPTRFMGFHRRGALPVLFQGLLSRVFDASTGVLLEDPDVLAITAVRQVCLMFKKVLLPCSTEREKRSYASYLDTDKSVADFELSLAQRWTSGPYVERNGSKPVACVLGQGGPRKWESPRVPASELCSHAGRTDLLHMELEHFRSVSDLLWGSTLNDRIDRFSPEALLPKHGPGATAERISGNRKFSLVRWHQRLDYSFPSDLFCIPNFGYADDLRGIEFVDPEHEQPVRVISVPKTLKTPRIIAIEPVCM
jgi:hypothetical protein